MGRDTQGQDIVGDLAQKATLKVTPAPYQAWLCVLPQPGPQWDTLTPHASSPDLWISEKEPAWDPCLVPTITPHKETPVRALYQ